MQSSSARHADAVSGILSLPCLNCHESAMPPDEHILPNMHCHANSQVASMNTGCVETTKPFFFYRLGFQHSIVLLF